MYNLNEEKIECDWQQGVLFLAEQENREECCVLISIQTTRFTMFFMSTLYVIRPVFYYS